jgi:hypothetical protein
MGTAIKNAETTPASGFLAPTVKGKEMRAGKTRKAFEVLKAEIESLYHDKALARQHFGEREIEGLDTTEAQAALRRIEDRIHAKEVVLPVVQQKDEAAHTALEEAKRQAAIEAEVEAVAQLKAVFMEVERIIVSLERATVDRLCPALNAARLVLSTSGIRDGELGFLSESPLVFKQFLSLAVHVLTREGYVPPNMRKYEHLSDCIPDDDFIRSRGRFGTNTPAPKPIPVWNSGN